VALSNASDKPLTFAFNLGGGSAAAGDTGTPVFSNGVVLNGNGTITVPAGVTSFTVTVPTTQDTLTEATETVPLTIGGLTATGSIVDNDALATVDLDGNDSSGATAGGYKTSYTENAAPVRIADSDITVTDADSPLLARATVTLTNAKAGDVLSILDTLPQGITASVVGNVVTFTGSASPAAYQAAIRAVGFANTSENPDTTARNLDVVVNDGSNDSAVVRATVTVAAVNDAPVVTIAANNVSEEGLPGGLGGANGTTNPAGTNACAGKIVFSDADSTNLTVSLTAPTTDVFSADGVKVTWASDGKGGLVGTAGTTKVATVTIDSSGNYAFNLAAPIKHSVAGEDTLAIKFGVSVNDGNLSGTSSLTINVKDDMPVAPAVIQHSLQTIDTNLLLVLDNSGSMGEASGIPGLTKLQASVQSIKTLLDQYDGLGGVAVRLVTFSSDATQVGGKWLTVDEAKTALNAVALANQTNYDAALDTAITAFGTANGKLSGAQSVAYFFSDGNPNLGNSGQSDAGINAAEEGTWTTFLNNNQINAYAVGLGTNVNQDALNPVAYNGQATENTQGIVVTNLSQLDGTLADTYAGSIKGNLKASGTFTAPMGADGFGHVDSVTVGGVLYKYNAAAPVLTVKTPAGADFVINMDTGEYTYNAPGQLAAATNENISFSLADKDGDLASSSLAISLERTLVLNGSANADQHGASQPSELLMGRDGNDVLVAGNGNNQLYGNNGNDQLTGGNGDDLVHGGSGADTLAGGGGSDVIIGGVGSDVLTGGAGADVFEWHFADPGTSAATRAEDTVKDFSVAAGDVLDLRDLLQGETTAALDKYLEFDTTGVNTIIKVSPTGAFPAGGAATNAAETQRIVLENVNLRSEFGLSPTSTDDIALINKLLAKGALVVDNG
jgi:Ca2+-binding RTX toxin-like protein